MIASTTALAAEVNVYSARKEALIKPILDDFSQQTGIKVNLVTGKADALIARLRSEGKLSPADLIISTDVGRLVRAKQAGLTQAQSLAGAADRVAPQFRDADAHWLALTLRARPIMYASSRVKPEALSTMLALADEQWKGRICIRSSGNIYNQSMVAAMMEIYPQEQVSAWAKGMVDNFARKPAGGDRDQIKAVAAGQCDIAVANTYYLAGMLNSQDPAEVKAAEQVSVYWPDQAGTGTHINISGIAITKHAKNKQSAQQLIDFMLSDEAQQWYAQANHEYPVVDGIEWSNTLIDMGTFKPQKVDLTAVGKANAAALMLMDSAGWR